MVVTVPRNGDFLEHACQVMVMELKDNDLIELGNQLEGISKMIILGKIAINNAGDIISSG